MSARMHMSLVEHGNRPKDPIAELHPVEGLNREGG